MARKSPRDLALRSTNSARQVESLNRTNIQKSYSIGKSLTEIAVKYGEDGIKHSRTTLKARNLPSSMSFIQDRCMFYESFRSEAQMKSACEHNIPFKMLYIVGTSKAHNRQARRAGVASLLKEARTGRRDFQAVVNAMGLGKRKRALPPGVNNATKMWHMQTVTSTDVRTMLRQIKSNNKLPNIPTIVNGMFEGIRRFDSSGEFLRGATSFDSVADKMYQQLSGKSGTATV